MVQACNIESAILKFHSSANELRTAIVADRVSMIDLEVEYALLKERTAIKNSIKQLLDSTEYESRSAEIIAFAMERREVNKKVLYNSALHSFGKADGTAIYQIIKQAV